MIISGKIRSLSICSCLLALLIIPAPDAHAATTEFTRDQSPAEQILRVGQLFSLTIGNPGELAAVTELDIESLPPDAVVLRNRNGTFTLLWVPQNEDLGELTLDVITLPDTLKYGTVTLTIANADQYERLRQESLFKAAPPTPLASVDSTPDETASADAASSEPLALSAEVTEPEVTEPEVTEPEVTEPEVTEPEVTEPEVTEPVVTEPEVTEPESHWNLKSLNLKSPNLKSPNLKSPNLKSPNLKSPNLKSLNLKSLNLKSPNLKSPNLKSPNLKSLNLKSLNLKSLNLKVPVSKSQNLKSMILQYTLRQVIHNNRPQTALRQEIISHQDMQKCLIQSWHRRPKRWSNFHPN